MTSEKNLKKQPTFISLKKTKESNAKKYTTNSSKHDNTTETWKLLIS